MYMDNDTEDRMTAGGCQISPTAPLQRDLYRLTPLQRAMIAGEMSPERWQRDLVQIRCYLDEQIDVLRLQNCLTKLVIRHDSLRATATWDDPVHGHQSVCEHATIPLQVVDLRAAAPAERLSSMDRARDAAWQHSIRVLNPPRLWAMLFQITECQQELVITYQETVLDEQSGKILIRELFELYDAMTAGSAPNLLPAVSFRNYLEWQSQQDIRENCHFWNDLLLRAPAPSPPPLLGVAECDHSFAFCCGTLKRQLSVASTRRLSAWANAHGATLGTALLAAWSRVVAQHAEEQHARFAAVFSERRPTYPNATSAVAMCFAVLPLVVEKPWQKSGDELLSHVLERERDLRAHSVLPDGDAGSRRGFGHPGGQSLVFFDEDDVDTHVHAAHPEWTQRRFELFGRNPYAIAMRGFGGPQLRIQAWYNPRLYGSVTVECLLDQLVAVLDSLPSPRFAPLAEATLLTPAHRKLLRTWSMGPRTPSDKRPLHRWFEDQTRKHPNAVAVVDSNNSLSYAELDAHSNQVASALIAAGLRRRETVGIIMGRTCQTIVAVLGVLKAGGVYNPLESSWPLERLRGIISRLETRLLVTDAIGAPKAAELATGPPGLTMLQLIGSIPAGVKPRTGRWLSPEQIAQHVKSAPAVDVAPDDPAYIIFTSGSTGFPKGVQVAHRSVSNLIDWARSTFAFSGTDRVLWVTSLAFDLSVFDIFGILACGGAIRVADEEEIASPERLLSILTTEPITFWNSAPQALGRVRLLLENRGVPSAAVRERLRLVFLSGDWVPTDLPTAIVEHFRKAQVIALGGATEAAVWSNYYPVDVIRPHWRSIPYGRPIRNARYYVLDAERRLCGLGVPGELYIGGSVIADGYARDSQQTAERFVKDPFAQKPRSRMYRTGDRVRWWPDGNMEILGRLDHQVKVRGYRVELGEIEAVLVQYPAVHQAVVAAHKNPQNENTLAAYLVPHAACHIDERELRAYMAQILPNYMLPSAIVVLEALPLNSNDKIDRHALPMPEIVRHQRDYPHVLPRTGHERRLAKIFEQVLQQQQIGIDDNFFAIGGDSLSALGVIFGAERIGIFLTVDMLRQMTLQELARQETIQQEAPLTTRGASGAEEVPLVPNQHWLLERGLASPAAYSFAVWLRVKGLLKLEALESAWRAVAAQHDSLRIQFCSANGALTQRVSAESQQFRIAFVDLRDCPPSELTTSLQAAVQPLWRNAKLSGEVLPRLAAAQGPNGRSYLFLFIPHIIIDEYSGRIIVDDLSAAYRALAANRPPELPRSTMSFAAWARHLTTHADDVSLERERCRLVALPWDRIALLPQDYVGSDNRYAEALDYRCTLSATATAELLAAARGIGVSVESLLLGPLSQVIGEWSASEYVLFDITGNGREALFNGLPLHRSVGYFSTIHPVILSSHQDLNPIAWMRNIGYQLADAPGRGTRYGMLRYLHTAPAMRRCLASLPVAQIKVNYHGLQPLCEPDSAFETAGIPIPAMLHPTDRRAYVLNLEISHAHGTLQMLWRYSGALHRPATIQRIADNYLHRLTASTRAISAGGMSDHGGSGCTC